MFGEVKRDVGGNGGSNKGDNGRGNEEHTFFFIFFS